MGKDEVRVYDDKHFAKSNILINSKQYTTLFGFKVVAIGLYKVQKGQYELSPGGGNLVCKIPASEIREKLGRKGNGLYGDLKDISTRLIEDHIRYDDPVRREFHYVSLVTSIKYANGILEITFNGDLREYLEDLGDHFTMLYLPC